MTFLDSERADAIVLAGLVIVGLLQAPIFLARRWLGLDDPGVDAGGRPAKR